MLRTEKRRDPADKHANGKKALTIADHIRHVVALAAENDERATRVECIRLIAELEEDFCERDRVADCADRRLCDDRFLRAELVLLQFLYKWRL